MSAAPKDPTEPTAPPGDVDNANPSTEPVDNNTNVVTADDNNNNNSDATGLLVAALMASATCRDAAELPEGLAECLQSEEALRRYVIAREEDNTIENILQVFELSRDQFNTIADKEATTEAKDVTEESKKQELGPPLAAPEEPLGKEARPYRSVLGDSAGTLVDCLHPSNVLLDHLEASSVLNSDMVQKVRCRPNRPDKVRVLLSFLMGLGPESLMSFIDALRATEQNSLANILAAQNFV